MPMRYYVMEADSSERMLLYSMPDLPLEENDDWMLGKLFAIAPEEPVVVCVQAGYERKEVLSYFDEVPIVSGKFLHALTRAGVDNLVTYNAELRSWDGALVCSGLKAMNIIGSIAASDADTIFLGKNRLIDASIDRLSISEAKAEGLMMFRLAENASAIVVSQHVKDSVERAGFSSVVFRDPHDFLAP